MVDTNKQNQENTQPDDVEITGMTDTPDDMDTIETESKAEDKIKALQAKLKAAEAEKTAAMEELHRNKADYLNARKRLEEDASAAKKRLEQKFIEELLPLCDSFAIAMQDEEVWNKVDEQWRKGVEGIHAQLGAILQRYNVQREDPIGAQFDPNRHEALSETTVDDEARHNTIIQVIQAGYYIDDEQHTLIRPARVVVGSYEDAAAATKQTSDNATDTDDT